jgi:hypothetical protein
VGGVARIVDDAVACCAGGVPDGAGTAGAHIYFVIRWYTVDSSSADEVVRRGEEGFVPLIGAVPGFIGYRMARTDGGILAVSIFERRGQAEATTGMAAAWGETNLASLLPNPPTVLGGERRLSRSNPAVRPRFGSIRVYHGAPDVDELVRRVGAVFVPIVRAVPGYASLAVLDCGEQTVMSLSTFGDREGAERSIREAAS